MLAIARKLNPKDPANAFDPLMLCRLDRHGFRAEHAESPPELAIFGWTGNDDGHYGFIVDDPRETADEYVIGMFYGDGTLCGIVAPRLPEFLGVLCRQIAQDEPEGEAGEKYRRVAKALKDGLDVKVPRWNVDVSGRAVRKRNAKKPIPTEDGIGLVLPDATVDRAYLSKLKWPKRKWPFDPEIPRDDRLLVEAERRLKSGEPGTALVIARNFFFHYVYDRNKRTEKARVKRIQNIAEKAYRALDRDYAADLVRLRTQFYMEWRDL
jgi:hypothetical protein